jgi:hypothetical protein
MIDVSVFKKKKFSLTISCKAVFVLIKFWVWMLSIFWIIAQSSPYVNLRYIPEDGNVHKYRCENLKSSLSFGSDCLTYECQHNVLLTVYLEACSKSIVGSVKLTVHKYVSRIDISYQLAVRVYPSWLKLLQFLRPFAVSV